MACHQIICQLLPSFVTTPRLCILSTFEMLYPHSAQNLHCSQMSGDCQACQRCRGILSTSKSESYLQIFYIVRNKSFLQIYRSNFHVCIRFGNKRVDRAADWRGAWHRSVSPYIFNDFQDAADISLQRLQGCCSTYTYSRSNVRWRYL
jgi:hypothetical protein